MFNVYNRFYIKTKKIWDHDEICCDRLMYDPV
jgi:hypothetical protein